MKKIIGLLFVAAIASFAIVSCKDDFNEADFLRLQSQLKLEQDSIDRKRDKAAAESVSKAAVDEYIAAANNAGDLLALTLLLRENGLPVSGVNVTLTSSSKSTLSNGRTQAAQTATSDASGNVVFDKVVIGSGSISFSKAGYVGATANVDFGTPGDPVAITVTNPNTSLPIIKYISPKKKFEEATIPMFSASATGGSTATIKGHVTIERDLTNTTPEIPAGTVLRANLTGLAIATSSFISSFAFSDDSTLGVATVSATGDYSMTVPAVASGISIPIIVPTIEGSQTVAVFSVNGVNENTDGTPNVRSNLATQWGPGFSYDTSLPVVLGAKAVFNVPLASGRGNSFTFTPVGRSLDVTTISSTTPTAAGNTFYSISNRGAGFTSSPTVDISGVGTTDDAETTLRGYVTDVNITDGGTGYPISTTVRLHFLYNDGTVNQSMATPAGGLFVNVTTTATGTLPTGALSLPTSTGFKGAASPFITGQDVASFSVAVTNLANVTITPTTNASITVGRTTELNSVIMKTSIAASNITTAPTFTLSSGGSTTPATVVVNSFKTQYSIGITGTATTPYSILPSDVRFYWPTVQGVENDITETAMIDRVSNAGVVEASNATLISNLSTDGTNLSKRITNSNLVTRRFWAVQPTAEIVDATLTPAQATVVLNTNGQVTGLTGITAGRGYHSVSQYNFSIQPSVSTAAPTQAAAVQLDFASDANTREVTWSTGTVVSGGAGYLVDVNRFKTVTGVANKAFSFKGSSTTGSVTVQAGKTYILDIDYGTGDRKDAIL
jgi:hypothetical protein